MRNFILATHGNFAEGIKNSLEIIYGNVDNIYCICAYTEKDVLLKSQIDKTIENIDNNKEIIVITDLFGGSVNNEFLSYIETHSIHLIAGLNLPLLIELVSVSEYIDDTELLIKNALESSKTSIQYCNDTIKSFSSSEDDEKF